MRWDAGSLFARMLHLLHQFVPDLYSVTLIAHLVKYCIQPLPTETFILGKYQISVA